MAIKDRSDMTGYRMMFDLVQLFTENSFYVKSQLERHVAFSLRSHVKVLTSLHNYLTFIDIIRMVQRRRHVKLSDKIFADKYMCFFRY